MEKTFLSVIVVLSLAFALPSAQSVHAREKTKDATPKNKQLSADEIRELKEKIEWFQKNSPEIDKRMFELGSKQLEISSTVWSNNWALLSFNLALEALLGALVGGLLYAIIKDRVLRAAEKRIKEKVDEATTRMEEHDSFLKTIIFRSQTYLALEIAETQQGELFYKYVELAAGFAKQSYEHAKKLVASVQKGKSMAEDDPQIQKYKDALAVASSNLAYALSQKEHATEEEKKRACQLAEDLYGPAIENNNFHRIDTYAWVLIHCGINEEKKNQGRQILRNLIANEDLSPAWRASRFKKYYQLFGEDP